MTEHAKPVLAWLLQWPWDKIIRMGQSYTIDIPPAIINDLKTRLTNARWPSEVDNDKWEAGSNKKYLQELCDYWQKGFDWSKQQEQLNRLDHFTTNIDGFQLHYIFQKGTGTRTIPLLLTHGFPDSFVRFLKIIPLLTMPDKNGVSFDVVVPSIPGYGFSEIPTEKGMDPRKIADLFTKLMTKELGFEQFVAHGGDWGTSITEQIALYHQSHLYCIHLTDVPFAHGMKPIENPSPAEKKMQEKTKAWMQKEGAYTALQSTKPQSLAYGLNDSPIGLAGWVIEKFYNWSDNHGDLENAFTKDELLTNLTIYWATETINSACRLYYEALQSIMNALYNPLVKLNPFDKTGDKTAVPTAFAMFTKDISDTPREYAERFFNVQRWTEISKGGHFAAMEQPGLLADDIRDFVRSMGI